jgi:hypothetical protein
MAFSLHFAVNRSALFAAAALLSISPVVAAQTPQSTTNDSTAKIALPDAPTATDAILTADNLSTPAPALFGTGFSQQASQNGAALTSRTQPPQQGQSSSAPSLDDLGLTPDQTKPDPDMQARLDRRTEMLKIHQRLGILTLAPLAAACISSVAAPPDPKNGSGNTVGRDLHLSLGAVSVGMYAMTASYAIRAPRIGDTPARGGIKLHKYLIYIHAPGMILTPILGAMAFNQANNGEKVHGIASAHSAVAWTTVASYSAAIVAVSWPIHLKL